MVLGLEGARRERDGGSRKMSRMPGLREDRLRNWVMSGDWETSQVFSHMGFQLKYSKPRKKKVIGFSKGV